MRDPLQITRRDLLGCMLGAPLAAAACRHPSPPLMLEGEIAGANHALGHRLRERASLEIPEGAWQRADVVIVGAGIAGLSAAWRLESAGFRDYVVLELESDAGGTSRSGSNRVSAYPWGAHYLPVPLANNTTLISLLREMDLIENPARDGTPVAREEHLVRDPQERVFHRGRWWEGLYLHAGASTEDLRQLEVFKAEIAKWVAFRDDRGRRGFVIPRADASDDERVANLDRISMHEWLDRRRLSSPRLRWFVDYACRDDYGTRLESTSAWAGVFYFASRVGKLGDEDEPLMTWPEGNGRFVKYFLSRCGARLRTSVAVTEIRESGDYVDVSCVDGRGQPVGFRAQRVIFAGPQFLRPFVFREAASQPGLTEFRYSPWMVANLTLRDRPEERDFPLAWDNVFYESPSLGYVCATHQRGIEHGPTVLTYYYALCHGEPRVERERLLGTGWREWADVALSDIGLAHPEIRDLTLRLDVMRWGHAMISPRTGFMFSEALRRAAVPQGRVHFAHSDLSGLALFEEAFHHGVRAADEILPLVAKT